MADLLQTAASWLTDQRDRFLSRQVTYRRGEREVMLPATLGSSTFEVINDIGVTETYESRDFLIRAADLALDGQTFLPDGGDRIIDSLAGRVMTYQVLAPGGQMPWRYSDRYRTTIRIHTKQVNEE